MTLHCKCMNLDCPNAHASDKPEPYGSIEVVRAADGTLSVVGEVPDRLGVSFELLGRLTADSEWSREAQASFLDGELTLLDYRFRQVGEDFPMDVAIFERLP